MQHRMHSALLSTRNMQSSDANKENTKHYNIEQLQSEVDTIANNLAEAKQMLSPKTIRFNKISLTSSLDSSLLARNLSVRSSVRKVKQSSSSVLNESCDTA